ncbi:MAG: hypothetical protein AAB446_01815, partial [Patescibacteria group bacterium]
RHATSFIAISSQGIHHTLLNFLLGNSKTTSVIEVTELSITAEIFLFNFLLPHKTIVSYGAFSTSNKQRPLPFGLQQPKEKRC